MYINIKDYFEMKENSSIIQIFNEILAKFKELNDNDEIYKFFGEMTQVIRQYYEYLIELMDAKAYVNVNKLTDYYYDMAYEGKWHEALQYMADSYAKISSVRDGIEAERNMQGFFMAYLSLNDYYYTAPELELSHGYCDFFLLPDLTHYEAKHSYIIELKMLPKKDFNVISKGESKTKAELQWDEAVEQINRYAAAPRVEVLRQGTQLHKIIMQFEGWELKNMKEV